jgi:hypothetical protein
MFKTIRQTIALLASGLHGCASLERQPAVPAERTTQAVVPGVTGNARYWVDTDLTLS